MIGRVTDRATFLRLARTPVVTRGPVRLRYLPLSLEAASPRRPQVRVAFSIGRSVGGAVTRNRVRRRLRAALGEVDRERPDGLPAGDYLVGADRRAEDLPFTTLVRDAGDAVEGAYQRALGRRPA